MKNGKISLIGVIALVLLVLLVMTVSAGCSSEPKIITTVSATENAPTVPTTEKNPTIDAIDESEVFVPCDDSTTINAKLFDTKKVFEEYITFLTESLEASEKNTLDIVEFQKRITWFSIVSESNINNNEREYKYAEVVYNSWISIRIESEFYNENSMTEELENAIRHTLTVLSNFRENPAKYPYPTNDT